MKGKMFVKVLMKLIMGNRELMLLVLFWILEELVKSTDNTIDDKALDMLREMLGPDGNVDTKQIKG